MTFDSRSPFAAVLVSLATLAGPALAAAQDVAPPRSPDGLFAGERVDRRVRQRLNLWVSFIEANDSDTTEIQLPGSDTVVGGLSTTVQGSAAYEWNGPRVRIAANESSVVRQYREVPDTSLASHSGGLGLTARLGARTSVALNQTAAYAPSYLFGLFPRSGPETPGAPPPIATDYAVDDSSSYVYGTSARLTRGLTRRSSLNAAADYHYTNFVQEDDERRDLTDAALRTDLQTHLGRNTSMRVGYRLREGTYGRDRFLSTNGADLHATEHGVDAGLEYARPLSASRRLMFTFGLGTSAVSVPLTATGTVSGRRSETRFSGDGAVAWEFARGWRLLASGRRSLEYVAQLNEPVFVNGLTGELAAVVTRRVDVTTSFRYANGVSALRDSVVKFDSYGADVRLRYALTRTLAVYGQYLSYYYDFGATAQLAAGVPASLDRTGVRAGFTLWLTTLRR